MTRSFKIHSSDYEGDMEGDPMDSSTPFTLAIHCTLPLIVCPKCQNEVDPRPVYLMAGECQNCGNVYYWDKENEKTILVEYIGPLWEEQ